MTYHFPGLHGCPNCLIFSGLLGFLDVPGFGECGYTNMLRDDVIENETDSDARPVKQPNGPETLAISGDFTLTADQVVHRPDAGVVGELIFDPEAKVEVDCATERALVELDNSASTADAAYSVDVYHGDVTDERSEEHTSELQSRTNLVCRLLLEKKKKKKKTKNNQSVSEHT